MDQSQEQSSNQPVSQKVETVDPATGDKQIFDPSPIVPGTDIQAADSPEIAVYDRLVPNDHESVLPMQPLDQIASSAGGNNNAEEQSGESSEGKPVANTSTAGYGDPIAHDLPEGTSPATKEARTEELEPVQEDEASREDVSMEPGETE